MRKDILPIFCLLLVIALLAVMIAAAAVNAEPSPYQKVTLPDGSSLNVLTIEGCEYINQPPYCLTHKGNCKNPIHYCKCSETSK